MMEEYITWLELCERWNIGKRKLIDLVNGDKLQAIFENDGSFLRVIEGGSYLEYKYPEDQMSLINPEPLTADEVTKLIFRVSDVEAYEKKEALKKNKQLTVTDYIQRRRTKGAKNDVIAFELHDPEGQFKLSHFNVAKELGLDEGLNEKQFAAIKQRGKRACDKGKAFLKNKIVSA